MAAWYLVLKEVGELSLASDGPAELYQRCVGCFGQNENKLKKTELNPCFRLWSSNEFHWRFHGAQCRISHCCFLKNILMRPQCFLSYWEHGRKNSHFVLFWHIFHVFQRSTEWRQEQKADILKYFVSFFHFFFFFFKNPKKFRLAVSCEERIEAMGWDISLDMLQVGGWA